MSFKIKPDTRPYSPAETLLYYDGPLVFFLQAQGTKYLAVALPESSRSPFPMLLTEITPEQACAIEAGKLRIRAAVEQGKAWFHLDDYDAPELELTRMSEVPAAWMPGDIDITPAR